MTATSTKGVATPTPLRRTPMQHCFAGFVEGVATTSLCGASTVSTAARHDPSAPRCVVCADLERMHNA